MDDMDKLLKLASAVGQLRKDVKELSTKAETITKLEGPQGLKGDKGDKGDPGVSGRDGLDGKDGKDGKDGVDGKDGQDGASIIDADIDIDGTFKFTLDNGTEISTTTSLLSQIPERINVFNTTSGSAGYLTNDSIGTTVQAFLVSGTNIKTINGNSLLGSGNLTISGGSGSAQVGTATINFGSTPVAEGFFTVTDAAITTASYINVFVMGDSTVDNDAESHRHAGASWNIVAVPNTGTFTVYITNMMDLCWGTFKIRYSYA